MRGRFADDGGGSRRDVRIDRCRHRRADADALIRRPSRRHLLPREREKDGRLRRLGELGLLQREGIIEPVRQGDDVRRLDRGAAPDAQARRRVAIGADVECDLFLLEQTREALGERGLRVGRQRGDLRDRPPSGKRWCWSASREPSPENRSRGSRRPNPRSPWRWRRRARRAPRRRPGSWPNAARRDSPRRRASRAC